MIDMINRLEQIRATLGLNQGQFAEKLGVSQSSYSKLIHGNRRIKSSLIDAVESLGIDRIWFISGEGYMFKSDESKYEPMMEIWNKLSEEGQDYILKKARKLLEMEKCAIV